MQDLRPSAEGAQEADAGHESTLQELRRHQVEDGTMRDHYSWYYRCQVECLTPIRIEYKGTERIKKLLIIPVIEERPDEPQMAPEEDDE